MAPQQCAFADTVPNMIPRLADTPREDTRDRLSILANPGTQRHGLYPDMSSLDSHSRSHAQTLLDLHRNISPHCLPSTPSLATDSKSFGLHSKMTDINMTSFQSNAQATSLPVLSKQGQDAPSVGKTIQVAPIPSNPTGIKVSRLPSNNVPRKAPLQGNSRLRDVSWKAPKPRQQRSTSRQETPARSAASVQKRRKSPSDGLRIAALQYAMALKETGEGKKGMADYHNQENEDIEGGVEAGKIRGYERGDRSDTAETTGSDKARSEEERRRGKGSRCKTTKKKQSVQPTQPTPPAQSNYIQRRRPMYEYEVPPELEGVRKALGM